MIYGFIRACLGMTLHLIFAKSAIRCRVLPTSGTVFREYQKNYTEAKQTRGYRDAFLCCARFEPAFFHSRADGRAGEVSVG
jgi:hypothetical protein